MRSGNKASTWNERAKVGIYLGKSPRHARKIAFVLNPKAGMVSSQCHVKFDNVFVTARKTRDSTDEILFLHHLTRVR